MPNLLNRANIAARVVIVLNSFRFPSHAKGGGGVHAEGTHSVLDSPSTPIPSRDFCLLLYRNRDLI